MYSNGHHPNGRWQHADLRFLFAEAGIALKARKDGKYEANHSYQHDSKSGRNLVVWADEGRWWCSSCKAKGDAADFLVDVGRASERAEAERILTERFGPPYTPDSPHLTDNGNAQRLVAAHGGRIKHCFPWGKWLVWTGKSWEIDNKGLIISYAKSISKRLYQEASEVAAKASAEPDETRRDTLAKSAQALLSWARQCESRSRIEAMIALARAEPGVPVLHEEMDTDPWLLNVENGVLDLRTGKLLPHDPRRLITKLVPTKYDPKAACPTWLSVLERSMAGNQNLMAFLQRAFGYALTGKVSEQVFFIFWGAGANGKGTIINTFLELLGDYALKATQELLMVTKGRSHPTELTKLFGARFVASSETEENQRLAEALVKELTGGDPITARRMKEDFWTFWPTHKIFLATNHQPVIRGTDHAIWRRPKLVPFNLVIPEHERDHDLPEKLKAEWPGILAWAVRGCLEWQKNGLGIPEEVEQATQEYRADMDMFGQFLLDCCIQRRDVSITSKDLYSAYLEWCNEQGIRQPWTQKVMGRSLVERGFDRKREPGSGRTLWLGLDLRGPEDYQPGTPPNPEPQGDAANFVNHCEPLGTFCEPSVNHCGYTCEREFDSVNHCEPNFAITGDEIFYIGNNATKVHNGSHRHEFADNGSQVISNPAQARALAEELAGQQYIGLDLETTGLDPHQDRIRLMQLSTPEQTWLIDAYHVPVTELKAVLEGGPIKIIQNAKFDWGFLYAQGIWLEPVFDVMLADQVIHHRSYGRGLGDLAQDYLDMEVPKELQTSDWSGDLKDEQLEYAERDAAILPSLASAITGRVRELKLEQVIDLENKALPAIAWMEFQGVGFDLDAWQALADKAEIRVKELRETLDQLALEGIGGRRVDWDSPKQVKEALNFLGVVVPDTKEETLQAHKTAHPVVAVLLDHREMSKRAGTYGVDWLRYLNMETGRIHADWKQIGAESGRMACKNPNLQNLPRSKDYRACFRADPGKVFIKADYSQIELRIAAEISGDKNLLKAFQNRQDVHVLAATYIIGKEASTVTADERQLAKAVNFGLIYGLGAKRLAVQAGQDYGIQLSEERATEIRNKYFKAFSGLRDWQRRQGQETLTRAPSGRWRTWSKTPPYTQLLNTPVQAAAADGMKLALAELCNTWTPDLVGCYPVLVIHDELIVEAPEDKADQAAEWVKRAMITGMGQLLNQVLVEVEVVVCHSYAGKE
jgi:P4 family phage/plasmid primase-like protien